jgi:hypothetical protein
MVRARYFDLYEGTNCPHVRAQQVLLPLRGQKELEMNRKNYFWAAAIFVMTFASMFFNLNPAYAQNGRTAVVCPDASLPNVAQTLCKDPTIASACASVCVQIQVQCVVNCAQPAPAPTTTATTPTPSTKKLAPLPTQLICEGGQTITNSEGKPDCSCPPEKVTDKDGVAHDVPRVAVMKSPLRYKTTDSTIQAIKTLTCVSTGDASKILNDVIQKNVAKIRKLEEFMETQGYVNEAVKQHIAMLWAEVNRLKGMLGNIMANITQININLYNMDKSIGMLRSEIDGLAEGSTSFSIAIEGSAFSMGDAGTALAPGLRLGFRSFFPGTKFGYYAMGNVGLIYRDGIEPGSGGAGSAYHAGAGTGLVFMLTENRALTGYAGFRFEQIFRTKDPNFLGAMFGGVLGLDYQIPDSHVFLGGEGFLAGTYHVAYFSNDGQVHMNNKPALFGGTIYVGLRTNLF